MSRFIREPPPKYKEKYETTNLIEDSTIMNAGHDNIVCLLEPHEEYREEDEKVRQPSSLCIRLFFVVLSGIFLGSVIFYCVGVSRRISSHRVNVYVKKEVHPPPVINIIQQKVILIKEIEAQAQPGRLNTMISNTKHNYHPYFHEHNRGHHCNRDEHPWNPYQWKTPYPDDQNKNRDNGYNTKTTNPENYYRTYSSYYRHQTATETLHEASDKKETATQWHHIDRPTEMPYQDKTSTETASSLPETDKFGFYCMDIATCFAYEIVDEPMTWHNAFRYCRQRNGFLPGRDIYYSLSLFNTFPSVLRPLVNEGVWSSSKVVHGHYQFLDQKPGFAYSLYGPTMRNNECGKFKYDRVTNTIALTQDNCRNTLRTACLYPVEAPITGENQDWSPRIRVESLEKTLEPLENNLKELPFIGVNRPRFNTPRIKAPFSIHHRRVNKNRPPVGVAAQQMKDIQLTCSGIPEDKVIWVKDGVFFKNGVSTTNLFQSPNTLDEPYSRQGTYWCEMWKQNSTERIASDKIYIYAHDVASVTVLLKENDFRLSDVICSLNANSTGCELQKSCWYWDAICSIQSQFGEAPWYTVEETLSLNMLDTLKSRASIQYFVDKKTLKEVDWSQINRTEIVHMVVWEPYLIEHFQNEYID